MSAGRLAGKLSGSGFSGWRSGLRSAKAQLPQCPPTSLGIGGSLRVGPALGFPCRRPSLVARLYAFTSVRFPKIRGTCVSVRPAAHSRWQCARSQVSELTARNKRIDRGEQEVGQPAPLARSVLIRGQSTAPAAPRCSLVDARPQLGGEDRARQSQHQFEIELQAARIEVGGADVYDVVHDEDLRVHHLRLILPLEMPARSRLGYRYCPARRDTGTSLCPGNSSRTGPRRAARRRRRRRRHVGRK